MIGALCVLLGASAIAMGIMWWHLVEARRLLKRAMISRVPEGLRKDIELYFGLVPTTWRDPDA